MELTLMNLKLAVIEHTEKHNYQPSGILMSLKQYSDLLKSGKELMRYMDPDNIHNFEDIPIVVEGSPTVLDLRNNQPREVKK